MSDEGFWFENIKYKYSQTIRTNNKERDSPDVISYRKIRLYGY